MSEIRIEGAKKVYGDVTVIENLSLTVPDGALFTLLGPSGCGKTTLLRMIAGFNSIEGGDFYFGDNRINNMEPSKRNIGMVFQNYAIFPHLTVRDNVAYGLKQKKATKEKVVAETDKYLKLMQIDEYRDRKPDQLSGGQQQRVALARALAVNPDVMLMDEPLSNLDAKLRVDMRQAIREIQREVGITTVYVTHDQEEAMAISDSIAVMNQGRIQQVGRPKELYHRPKNEFVASFIGRTNIIQANLKHDGATALLEFSTGYRMPLPILNNVADQPVHVSIRPEELIRTADGDIDAQITDSVYLGMDTEYFVDLPFAKKIHVSEESSLTEDLGEGDHIKLKINAQKINVFTADGSQNLLGVD
ncbi:Maltose/maltodextrin import ATP-binding protein MalK [Lacticaseibacillus paracasei]|uniref:ABC transporter ATP-binding protein n=1 Tax=Lacticaseibacillus paracasei TaxID=1597 RepID=UPI000F0B6737|nr:ABC transporter ATP-binding protein [Lacticaseibacillus paracasei]RND39080.1 Maltose/maltodextrin import ATP-binding protein MalK [Lacticaseibacillus paracasei]RND45897.1 Maltose/maltodextrin import ATP-binding protein MalK [Lacticaseibacillus paracasei]RND72628.1 Maltose/maltodextrin import ATP-binding protein MalK [Lacticaseibacillus paracasei]